MKGETLFTILAIVVLLLFAAELARAEETVLFGRAEVIDGDTLRIGDVKVRLNGLDAPEMDTYVGKAARLGMLEIVDGRKLECDLNGEVTYDRMVGSCYLANGDNAGADVALMLIQQGLALDCARYSGGRYATEETAFAVAHIERAGYCALRN